MKGRRRSRAPGSLSWNLPSSSGGRQVLLHHYLLSTFVFDTLSIKNMYCKCHRHGVLFVANTGVAVEVIACDPRYKEDLKRITDFM